MTPASPLHAAALLLGHLYRHPDDGHARDRLAGLVDGLARGDRATFEAVAKGLSKRVAWWMVGVESEATA